MSPNGRRFRATKREQFRYGSYRFAVFHFTKRAQGSNLAEAPIGARRLFAFSLPYTGQLPPAEANQTKTS